MKQTPLNQVHRNLKARMVPFGGWDMPVQYSSVIEEHKAVREKAGLFDISHMGEIIVEGKRALEFVNYLTTNDLTKISSGGCQYAAMCYENGGVVDDVISYVYSPQKVLVVVNASNTDKDFAWMQQHKWDGVTIKNESPNYGQLALQGPKSEAILQPLVSIPLKNLRYYTFSEASFLGKPCLVSRTGYTGEDGFEIYMPSNECESYWNALMEAGQSHGIKPIGLAARDTLRLEASYSLYGHEISESINPLEARLGWIVKLDKANFIGKDALKKIKEGGIKRTLVGLEMIDAAIPRDGYEVFDGDKKVGQVTSGTFIPTLNKGVAMALIDAQSAASQNLQVQVRKDLKRAKIVPLPFYKR